MYSEESVSTARERRVAVSGLVAEWRGGTMERECWRVAGPANEVLLKAAFSAGGYTVMITDGARSGSHPAPGTSRLVCIRQIHRYRFFGPGLHVWEQNGIYME